MRYLVIVVLFGVVSLATAARSVGPVVFQQGADVAEFGIVDYAGVEDGMIWTGQPNSDLSTGALARVGQTQNVPPDDPAGGRGRHQILMRFDLGAVAADPRTYTCTGATLRFYLGAVSNSPTIGVYSISDANGDWEITGDHASYAYKNYPDRVRWAGGLLVDGLGNPDDRGGLHVAGTDYDATPLASLIVPADGYYDFVFSDLSVVDRWLSGDNNGMLLGTDPIYLWSIPEQRYAWNSVLSEYTNIPERRPQLILTLSVPEPASAGMLALCTLVVLARRKDRVRRG